MPTRTATAQWNGGIRTGSGTFKGESGAIGSGYSFNARFGDEAGTNPEELLAAAEAACFSMALSGNLERAGLKPESIDTTAKCTVEKKGDGFAITTMHLTVRAKVPGADRDAFKDIALKTKDTCPVSMALMGNVQIEVDAQLA